MKSAKSPSDAKVDLVVLEVITDYPTRHELGSFSSRLRSRFRTAPSQSAWRTRTTRRSTPITRDSTSARRTSPRTASSRGRCFRTSLTERTKRSACKQPYICKPKRTSFSKALGGDYKKDTQFCVSKRNMVFAEVSTPRKRALRLLS